jgi:hypothetical protein
MNIKIVVLDRREYIILRIHPCRLDEIKHIFCHLKLVSGTDNFLGDRGTFKIAQGAQVSVAQPGAS